MWIAGKGRDENGRTRENAARLSQSAVSPSLKIIKLVCMFNFYNMCRQHCKEI